jgi:beta-lactamase class A
VPPDLTRRGALAAVLVAVGAGSTGAAQDQFAELEVQSGGRLGVAALDTRNGARLAHRAGERFAMCSTFKLLAVSAVLAEVDRGAEHLDLFIPYGEADLLSYAPVTRAHVAEGGLPLATLCEAAIELSDNTAANLILQALGGPGAVTAFARTIGDPITHLDRNEPTLNEIRPGDERDTTCPAAMLEDLRKLTLGGVLSPASRERLTDWLVAGKTGDTRLRAGFPAGWRVGDKTGTGEHGTANDVAIAWAPGGPILIAAYLTGADGIAAADRDAILAGVAKVVTAGFRGQPHG